MRRLLDSKEVSGSRPRGCHDHPGGRELKGAPDPRVTIAMALDGHFDGVFKWVRQELPAVGARRQRPGRP